MANVLSAWSRLDTKRRLVAALAGLAVFAAVIALARGPGPGPMALLYAGLEPAAAGEVVTALEARGIPHEVRGPAIWVPRSERDSLRMSLAAEGLPAAGGAGYELLDGLSGFGTTSQMFDAAYWRAKEGELARTIVAVPGITSARVHIARRDSGPFARAAEAGAAVTVGTASGALAAEQAEALRHLVASAVPGLAARDVAVIDAAGGRLARSSDESRDADSRAEALRARAERVLAARVGPGNAVVEVSVETVTEQEQISERRIDPDSRVAISTETEERKDSASGGGGAVTVASNLPDGDAAEEGRSSEGSESRALTNYEVSETSREVLRAPGAIRRLSVAVLVNDTEVTAEDGTVSRVPRSEDELAALEALVASAVGLDPARGDVLTLRSLAFEPAAAPGAAALDLPAGPPLDPRMLIQTGVLAAVALILGLFVLRPILASGRATAAGPAEALLPAMAAPGQEVLPAAMAPPGASRFDPLDKAETEPDPLDRLRRLIDERQDDTIQILQSWVEESDETERSP